MSLDHPVIEVLSRDADSAGLPVVIGVPFERGVLADPSRLALIAPSGRPCPLAARTLIPWSDGSTRWALLSFLASEEGPHQVPLAGAAAPDAPSPVTLDLSDERAVIDNGQVRVVLAAEGPGPIAEIAALGHTWVARPEDLRFVVDAADTRREQRRALRVMEQSPLRVRVRIEGAHFDASGDRLLDYRLDVEVWAGWPALRMDYHFFNLTPGREEIVVERMALECDLALEGDTQRHFLQNVHGLRYIPREVLNPAPVAIVADDARGKPYVEDPAMLLDDVQYPVHLRPPLVDVADWLGVSDGRRALYLHMQDFGSLRPKRLASAGAKLELEFWPASKGPLTLFQGRSRRQVITLAFADSALLPAPEAARRLGALLADGRATIAPAWLRRCREFDMDRLMAAGANVRFEKFLRRLVQLRTTQDMWDLGDTIDSGYSRTYPPIGLDAQPLRPGAPDMPRVFLAGAHSPVADWSFPERFEPVWTNNEYDVIHALCSEIMRTGMGDYWQAARWFARHNIEVDFIHYHDDLQQNRATSQHSFRHNRSGSVPSHFWTQGLLEYYCLTGDADVVEIATALGDKIIEDMQEPELRASFWGFTRELGWPSLALAHLVDITGEERHRRQLEEIVEFFMGYDRRKFHGPIKLSGANARHTLERQMVTSIFGYACMIEGVDHYQRRTGREDVKVWLVQLLHELRESLDAAHAEGQPLGGMHPHVMAIGYEQTGDVRFLRSGMLCLDELVDSALWRHPPGETKPVAVTYRAVVRFLHHAHCAGLLQRLEYPGAR